MPISSRFAARPASLFAAAIALGALLASPGNRAIADDYPSRVVRVIVPLTVGGGGDIFARAIAEELKNDLGQPFIVENRSGASEILGTRACAEAPPDGYTICITSQEPIVFNPLLFKSIPYDPDKDLTPVIKLFINLATVAVTTTRGINSLDDMVAVAKARPGTLTYGTFAFPLEQLITRLNKENGTDIAKVSFRGGADLATAMLSDSTPIGAVGIANILPYLEDGRFKALAINGDRRLRMFPNVPTLDELRKGEQYPPSWFGMFAPAATPKAIVERLAETTARHMENASFRDRMFEPRGIAPADFKLDAFRKFIAEDRAIAARLVKEAGIEPK